MAQIIVLNHVSLDGVMQAPGRADENRRGGELIRSLIGLTDSVTTSAGGVIATYASGDA